MLARKIILKNHFNGAPTLNNFELVEERLPDVLQDGGRLSLLFFPSLSINSYTDLFLYLEKYIKEARGLAK